MSQVTKNVETETFTSHTEIVEFLNNLKEFGEPVFVDWTKNLVKFVVTKCIALECEVPPEMTPEYWDSMEQGEWTSYGKRDEYGGL